MNARFLSLVLDRVRKIEIQIPRLALLHVDALMIEEKFYIRARLHRDMNAGDPVLEAEFVIAMLTDRRAGSQTQEPCGLKVAFERIEDSRHILAAIQHFGITERCSSRS